jgi:iron(III) transport system ATP-binding protein
MNSTSIERQGGAPRPAAVSVPSPSAVSISGLSKVYSGGVKAVDDISLTVPEGHLVVLLGPSGCGKTTLLRCIAGLEQPTAGEISVAGTIVFSRGIFVEPERRGLGMMFQSYALWPHMTVFNNIAYPLTSGTGLSREEIRATVAGHMQKLGLEGLDARYPAELSGGQQQRVALARALARRPSVLLFDEPLSNVDAKVRRRLRFELREIKKATGFSGVYVTHDQEEAMELADTLVVMEKGTIAQSGSTREIYQKPSTSYVAGFVGEACQFSATVVASGPRLRVDTDLGQLDLPAPATPPVVGATGWVIARPERIRLGPPKTADAVRARARVIESFFLGGRSEVRLLIGGTSAIASLTDPDVEAPEAGAEVDISIAREALLWLPR